MLSFQWILKHTNYTAVSVWMARSEQPSIDGENFIMTTQQSRPMVSKLSGLTMQHFSSVMIVRITMQYFWSKSIWQMYADYMACHGSPEEWCLPAQLRPRIVTASLSGAAVQSRDRMPGGGGNVWRRRWPLKEAGARGRCWRRWAWLLSGAGLPCSGYQTRSRHTSWGRHRPSSRETHRCQTEQWRWPPGTMCGQWRIHRRPGLSCLCQPSPQYHHLKLLQDHCPPPCLRSLLLWSGWTCQSWPRERFWESPAVLMRCWPWPLGAIWNLPWCEDLRSRSTNQSWNTMMLTTLGIIAGVKVCNKNR